MYISSNAAADAFFRLLSRLVKTLWLTVCEYVLKRRPVKSIKSRSRSMRSRSLLCVLCHVIVYNRISPPSIFFPFFPFQTQKWFIHLVRKQRWLSFFLTFHQSILSIVVDLTFSRHRHRTAIRSSPPSFVASVSVWVSKKKKSGTSFGNCKQFKLLDSSRAVWVFYMHV